MFESRSYLIIPTSEVSKVDFSKVFETSADTLRKSVDGTKTFIKWGESPYADQPDFVVNISGKKDLIIIHKYQQYSPEQTGQNHKRNNGKFCRT